MAEEKSGPKSNNALEGILLIILLLLALSGYLNKGSQTLSERDRLNLPASGDGSYIGDGSFIDKDGNGIDDRIDDGSFIDKNNNGIDDRLEGGSGGRADGGYKPVEKSIFNFGSLLGPGILKKGTEVINKNALAVRKEAAGAIIGEQAKRIKGKIVDGPILSFGTTWWKINYPDAPDGWVSQEDITSRIRAFTVLEIIPIIYEIIKPIGFIFVILLLIFIMIIKSKLGTVLLIAQKKRKMIDEKVEEEQKLNEPVVVAGIPNLPVGNNEAPTSVSRNPRWDHIQELLVSRSVNDWRQAIIESDIVLDEMLKRMGYEGESVGERMKGIERSDFVTLDKAWEAHKVRNRIAHDGIDFQITRKEAERVIKLYKEVFEEFYFI